MQATNNYQTKKILIFSQKDEHLGKCAIAHRSTPLALGEERLYIS